MSHSFESIDYSLRPAKYAERRMLRDIFGRLRPFAQIEEYRYVGLGSVWFSDFVLFHRALGIKDMVSIERAVGSAARFDENRPFRITMKYGTSTAELPKLTWTQKQFVWLDYDGAIRPEMLRDVRFVASKIPSGSVLAVTLRCSSSRETDQFRSERADGDESDERSPCVRFLENFANWNIRADIIDADLEGFEFGALSRAILSEQILDTLARRKSDETAGLMNFREICNFEYADGDKMTTLVGIFYSDIDTPLIDECDFSGLDFMKQPPASVEIRVPKLTPKEYRHLESQLPLPSGSTFALGTIPAAQATHFRELYRYLPTYAVLEN